jgi:hypothetical protein
MFIRVQFGIAIDRGAVLHKAFVPVYDLTCQAQLHRIAYRKVHYALKRRAVIVSYPQFGITFKFVGRGGR